MQIGKGREPYPVLFVNSEIQDRCFCFCRPDRNRREVIRDAARYCPSGENKLGDSMVECLLVVRDYNMLQNSMVSNTLTMHIHIASGNSIVIAVKKQVASLSVYPTKRQAALWRVHTTTDRCLLRRRDGCHLAFQKLQYRCLYTCRAIAFSGSAHVVMSLLLVSIIGIVYR